MQQLVSEDKHFLCESVDNALLSLKLLVVNSHAETTGCFCLFVCLFVFFF